MQLLQKTFWLKVKHKVNEMKDLAALSHNIAKN